MTLLETLLFIPPLYKDSISVKALTYIGKGTTPNFTYKDLGLPLKQNLLLIKIITAALNPIDLQLLETPLSVTNSGNKGIGRDFCGVVEIVGKNHASKWKVGDKVCGTFIHINGQGSVASHIYIDPSIDPIVKVPPNISDNEAAAFPLALGAAISSMAHAKLDSSSWVCILGGATAVGQFAIQLAKNLYNVDKLVVSCSQASSQFCKDLGADVTVDYRGAANIGDSLLYVLGHKNVQSSSFVASENTSIAPQNTDSATPAPARFQLILDCAGGTDVLFKAYSLLTPQASGSAYVTLVGDQQRRSYNPAMFGRKVMSATGLLGVNYIVENVLPGDWLLKAYDLMLERTVSVTIDSVYDWNDWKKAIARQADPKHRGKVVLKITT